MTLSVWRGLRLQGGLASGGGYDFEPVILLPEDDGHAVVAVNAASQERSARLLGATGRVVLEDAGEVGEPFVGAHAGWPLDGLHGSEPDARVGLVHRGTRHYRELVGLWLQPEPLLVLVLGVPDGSLGTPRLLMGTYAAGNVNVWADPSGYIPVETFWDAANVVMGAASFVANVKAGSYGAALVDAVGVVTDVAATVTPYAPGGAASAIKLARAADATTTALSTANKVDGAVDASKAAGAAVDASKGVPTPKAGAAGGEGAGKAFPKSVKDQARAESGDTCVFCGSGTSGPGSPPGPKKSEIDHAIPKSRGGNNSLDNAQNSCRTCNREKGAKTTEEFVDD